MKKKKKKIQNKHNIINHTKMEHNLVIQLNQMFFLSPLFNLYNDVTMSTLLQVNKLKSITRSQTLIVLTAQCEMFLLFIRNGMTVAIDIFIRISFLLLILDIAKIIYNTISINLIKIFKFECVDSNGGDATVFTSHMYQITWNNILFCCY